MGTPGSGKPRRAVGRLEWIVGGLGAVLFAGVLAALAHEAVTSPDGPPDLSARVLVVDRASGGFVVRFLMHNDGPATAAEVVVRATLRKDGREIEAAETTFDYVARRSSREGGVIFRNDPGQAELALAAVAYRKP